MPNVFNYSSAYLVSPQSKNPANNYPIAEARCAVQEKTGDAPIERYSVVVTPTNLAGTATAVGDYSVLLPMTPGARVWSLSAVVATAATGGALTASFGNATSATAYGAAQSLASAGALTGPTPAQLDAAAAIGANDGLTLTIASVGFTGPATVNFTVSYGVP